MVCSYPLGALALGFPEWWRPRSVLTCVLPRAIPPSIKESEKSAACAGLGDSQANQAVNIGWLLLVLGLGLTEASCFVFDRI